MGAVANRSTAIGYRFRVAPIEARAEMLAAIDEFGGNTREIARVHDMTIRQVQRIVGREGLWQAVREARERARAARMRTDEQWARTLQEFGTWTRR